MREKSDRAHVCQRQCSWGRSVCLLILCVLPLACEENSFDESGGGEARRDLAPAEQGSPRADQRLDGDAPEFQGADMLPTPECLTALEPLLLDREGCLFFGPLWSRTEGSWLESPARWFIEESPEGSDLQLWIAAPEESEAIELSLFGFVADRHLRLGHQSWGYSGPILTGPALATGGDQRLLAREGQTGDPAFAEPSTSYGVGLLQAGEDGPGLLWGALDSEEVQSVFAAARLDESAAGDPSTAIELRLRLGFDPLPLPVSAHPPEEPPPGGSRWLGPWRLAAFEGLEGAAAALDAQREAISALLSIPEPRRPAGGWFTWNEHFEEIDEALILANIEAAEAHLAPAELPLIEIDDGWQRGWGDWRFNEAFPRGLEEISAEVEARGLTLGIWMAPFLIERSVAEALEIPTEHLLREPESGAPIIHRIIGNPRPYHLLDASHPEAMRLVTEPLRSLREAGSASSNSTSSTGACSLGSVMSR